MRFVRVMEMPGDDMVDVIAVRNAFVAATRAVSVRRVVPGARMAAAASRGIFATCSDDVFVNVSFVNVVEVAVVNVIDVALVPNCGVAAIRRMCMLMFGMHGVR